MGLNLFYMYHIDYILSADIYSYLLLDKCYNVCIPSSLLLVLHIDYPIQTSMIPLGK